MNLRHRHALPLTRPAVSSQAGLKKVAETEPTMHPLKEKCSQPTHVKLVFCAVCLKFFIAAFMPEVLFFSSPRIIKKICIHP